MRRPATIFILIAALMLASVVVTFAIGNYVIRADKLVDRRQQAVFNLQMLLSTVKDAETGQRGYLLTGDDQYLDPYHAAISQLHDNLRILDAAADGTVLRTQDVSELSRLIDAKNVELSETIDLRKSQGSAAAIAVVQRGHGKQLMEDIRALVTRLSDAETTEQHILADDSHSATQFRTALFIAVGVLNLSFLVWAFRQLDREMKERVAAAAKVAEQKELLAVTLASIGDAVIVTDADARVTYLNILAEKLTGWTTAQALSQPLTEVFKIVNEDTRATVESPVSKAIRMGAIVGLANHTLLISKDLTEHPIDDSAGPIRNDAGQIIGVVMVFRDISDRKSSEGRLRNSERRYRRLFEAAPDGIFIVDAANSKITDVNPFMIQLLDHPRGHFLGKELWEIGAFKDKAEGDSAMQRLHQDGSLRIENLFLPDRNGRRRPVEIVANLYQEDNEPVIQCNVHDMAERVQFEREREALLANEQSARMDAEAANRAKDLFLATLSHEMRTPLNAIVGWMSILRQKDCTPADIKEGLDVIERNTQAQAQLIEDVLDVSRIISGKLRLEMKPCDLTVAIRGAIDVVRPAADAKGIVIESEIDPVAAPNYCDIARIQQVAWNLLSNSVKFAPKKDGRVKISLTRESSRTHITVSDNGQGIPPEFLPHVFDRFSQADSSTRRHYGGLGLGLSIVKHIVELHGGTVHANSEGKGKGATFIVELPIKAVRTVESEEPDDDGNGHSSGEFRAGAASRKSRPGAPLFVAPSSIRLDGLRVLMVDDEPDARRLLTKVLQDAGADVTAAAGAAEAIAALPKASPHIVISDLGMPEMDGFDLIRHIRQSGRTGDQLPAVALTAFARREDERRALLAGFQIHIAKPVDPQDLMAVVASLAKR